MSICRRRLVMAGHVKVVKSMLRAGTCSRKHATRERLRYNCSKQRTQGRHPQLREYAWKAPAEKRGRLEGTYIKEGVPERRALLACANYLQKQHFCHVGWYACCRQARG